GAPSVRRAYSAFLRPDRLLKISSRRCMFTAPGECPPHCPSNEARSANLPECRQVAQSRTRSCHSKMRSSYSSKVESSCSKPANWPDERTGDAGVSLLSCFGSAIKGAPLLARPPEYQPLTASSC